MSLIRKLPPALLVLLLSGCSPWQAPATAPPTARPTASPVSVTPTLAASMTHPVIVLDRSGRSQALGVIRNQAEHPVSDLELQIHFLRAPGGEQLASLTTAPLLPHLGPGAASPYAILYPGDGAPGAVEASLVSYREWAGETAEVVVSLARVLPQPEGGVRLLGFLRLVSNSPATLDSLAITAAGADGDLIGLADQLVAPAYLAPGETLPFEAHLPLPVPLAAAQPYTAAAATDLAPKPPFELDLEPGWQNDPQGHPFLVGVLRNPADRAHSGQVLLAFRDGDDPFGLAALDARIPLAAGEQRPFAVTAPWLSSRIEPSELELDSYSLPGPDLGRAASPVALQFEVTTAEVIGGRAFFHVRVTNDHAEAVLSPTLLFALRGGDGSLWSAAWHPLAQELGPGEERRAVISVPLPEGIDFPLGEFDLRALGLAAP